MGAEQPLKAQRCTMLVPLAEHGKEMAGRTAAAAYVPLSERSEPAAYVPLSERSEPKLPTSELLSFRTLWMVQSGLRHIGNPEVGISGGACEARKPTRCALRDTLYADGSCLCGTGASLRAIHGRFTARGVLLSIRACAEETRFVPVREVWWALLTRQR
jgi:hypothetical protein